MLERHVFKMTTVLDTVYLPPLEALVNHFAVFEIAYWLSIFKIIHFPSELV